MIETKCPEINKVLGSLSFNLPRLTRNSPPAEDSQCFHSPYTNCLFLWSASIKLWFLQGWLPQPEVTGNDDTTVFSHMQRYCLSYQRQPLIFTTKLGEGLNMIWWCTTWLIFRIYSLQLQMDQASLWPKGAKLATIIFVEDDITGNTTHVLSFVHQEKSIKSSHFLPDPTNCVEVFNKKTQPM